jgi:hypothetical protein
MASPSVSTAAVLSSFPFRTITPIATGGTSIPTHASLQLAQRQLNANAQSIFTMAGTGLHGHLVLTMAPIPFLAMTAGVAHPPPVHPGPVLAATNVARAIHMELASTFTTYHTTDNALKQQLMEACPSVYIRALEDPLLGFSNVTTLAILTHLRTTYGSISPAALDANLLQMQTPWHPPSPLEDLFFQLDEAAAFAIAGLAPIGDANVLRAGYNIIKNTGLFRDACHEWYNRPVPTQTLADFKLHFTAANVERESTASDAGYHAAAAATAAKPSLELQLAALEQLLWTLDTKVSALPALGNNRNPLPSLAGSPPPTVSSFCWTHGSGRNLSHTSATCKNKAPGHQDTATSSNTMGSSKLGHTSNP